MADLNCLTGFICARAACGSGLVSAPKSGLFVEDLPGISMESMAAVEPGKYVNVQTFIDEKMRTAGQMVSDRIRATLDEYVRARGPKEAGTVGTWDAEGTTIASSVNPRGLRITFGGGAMSMGSVSRIWLRSSTAVTGLVVTLRDGPETRTYTVDLEADVETELWLNYEARTKSVDITVAEDDFTPVTGSTKGTRYFSTCSTCGQLGRYATISGTGLLNGASTDELQGMRAEVVMLCSIDPVLCILLKRYRFAVLYQWGVLVLQEWLASPRTNYFTIHSRDWAAGTVELWEKVELPRALKAQNSTLAHFVSQLDPECLTCGSGAHYGYSHP